MAPLAILVILVASLGIRLMVRPQSIAVHEPFHSRRGRELIHAQVAYQAAFGCFAGRLECLAKPSDCDSIVPAAATAFLNPEVASLAKDEGYSFEFSPGNSMLDCRASGGVDAYAYVGTPDRATVEDAPGFCVDHTGRICLTFDGSTPEVRGARCVVVPGEPPGWFGALLTVLGLGEPPPPRACYLVESGSSPGSAAIRR
jgi:hypothetical protein